MFAKLNYSDPAVLRGIIMAVIGLLVALGITLPSNLPTLVDSLISVVAFVLPIVQGFWTRKSVVSPQTHEAARLQK